MRNRKHIVSKFNLVLFLCSFTLFTVNSFSNFLSTSSSSHFSKQISEKPSAIMDGSTQQLSEKNETETEDGFELQELALPFFISYFQFEISRSSYSSVPPLAEQLSNPIYLSVHNFRI